MTPTRRTLLSTLAAAALLAGTASSRFYGGLWSVVRRRSLREAVAEELVWRECDRYSLGAPMYDGYVSSQHVVEDGQTAGSYMGVGQEDWLAHRERIIDTITSSMEAFERREGVHIVTDVLA